MDVASTCAPAAVRMANSPNKADPNDLSLLEAYNNIRIVFPHIYEALKR